MAEGIGVAASVVTLVNLGGKLGKAIQGYRHAPAEILALHNELIGLKSGFSRMETLCTEVPDSADISQQAERFTALVNQASSVVKSSVGWDTKFVTRHGRMRWSIRDKRKAEELVAQLKEMRTNFSTIIAVDSRAKADQIYSEVHQIAAELPRWKAHTETAMRQISSSASQRHQKTCTLLSQQAFEIHSAREESRKVDNETCAAFAGQDKLLHHILSENMKGNQVTQVGLAHLTERTQELDENVTCILDIAHGITQNYRSLGRRLSHIQQQLLEMQQTQPHNCSANLSDNIMGPKFICRKTPQDLGKLVPVALTIGSCTKLKIRCSCHCHETTIVQTPNCLLSIIGRLSLILKGSPIRMCTCTVALCKNSGVGQRLRLSYFFPPFWIATVLTLSYSYKNALLATITMYNVLSPDDYALFLAQTGNINELKQFLKDNMARPTDTDEWGRSLLWWAADHKQLEMFKFLIDCGANPSHTHSYGESTLDLLWSRAFSGQEVANWISIMPATSNSNPEVDWEFTPLHELVVGIEHHISLDALLRTNSNVDASDTHGRTALWWAAARGDIMSARALLRHNADPNYRDNSGRSPFFAALLWHADNLDLLDLFLENRANPNSIDQAGATALHLIAYNSSSCEAAKRISQLDIDVNRVDKGGDTPLTLACLNNRDKVARYLLDVGADVDQRNVYGSSPLLISIVCHSYESLHVVLQFNPDCQSADSWGRTVLMRACWKGDITILDILSSYGIGNRLDPLAKDENGQTVFSDQWIPFYVHGRSRLNALLRCIASGHCTPCTLAARYGIPAPDGGCSHGMLEELGLHDIVDDMVSRMWFTDETECNNEDDSDHSSEGYEYNSDEDLYFDAMEETEADLTMEG